MEGISTDASDSITTPPPSSSSTPPPLHHTPTTPPVAPATPPVASAASIMAMAMERVSAQQQQGVSAVSDGVGVGERGMVESTVQGGPVDGLDLPQQQVSVFGFR